MEIEENKHYKVEYTDGSEYYCGGNYLIWYIERYPELVKKVTEHEIG